MILYHGSYKVIDKPDLSFSRLRTDFGRGFYLTPFKEQALLWSKKYIREYDMAIISCYEFSLETGNKLPTEIKKLEFREYSLDWLNFITACRLGKSGLEQVNESDYDLIIGGVANDKVFDTLQLYFDNLIRAEEAIGRLRFEKPNLQYCLKTQLLIDNFLKFTGSEAVK